MQDLKFYRQYSVGSYILDFYCPKKRLCIEADGGQHAEEDGERHDEKRSQYLHTKGIKVIRFWNNEILRNPQGAWDVIYDTLQKS